MPALGSQAPPLGPPLVAGRPKLAEMKASFVRDSKFRHVFGDPLKTRYEDLRLSSKQTESTGIRANSKYFVFPWDSGGGGALAVLQMGKFGRQPRDLPLITGHAGPILDFEFDPFDDSLLLSCSEDMTVKLWQIPEGGLKSHMREPLVNLEGHGKKVSFCTFNPTAHRIVASTAFDMTVKVWNLEEQECAFSIDIPEQVWSFKWNYTGNLLCATCKDKKMRIIDPRQNTIALETKIHEGVKASKVEWIGSTDQDECNKLVTTGFTPQAERQMCMWDMRTFSDSGEASPLNLLVMDSGTGALYPFFDPGTSMLYIAGKGDANVRYFEVVKEDPHLYFIDTFSATKPQKGFCFVPKRCVDVTKHEVMLGMKLEANAVQPVSFKVPRKAETFQEDIFPDCAAGVPSMTAEEFVSTDAVKPPILRSMAPGDEAVAQAAAAAPKAAAGMVTMKDLKKQLADAMARIKELEAENARLKAELEAKQ